MSPFAKVEGICYKISKLQHCRNVFESLECMAVNEKEGLVTLVVFSPFRRKCNAYFSSLKRGRGKKFGGIKISLETNNDLNI